MSASAAVVSKWDQSKFDSALKTYLQFSSKTVGEVLNTKAYYVARKANWFTHKADRGGIASSLGQVRTVEYTTKRGTTRKRKTLELAPATKRKTEIPLAALIIYKRRSKDGLPWVHWESAEMKRSIRELLAARNRSIGYLASGWIPAIRLLAKFADKRGEPPMDPKTRRYGRPKGNAIPVSKNAQVMVVKIINEAWTKRQGDKGLQKFGTKGLQVAFDDETKSMHEYIIKKMMIPNQKFNEAQR